MVDALPSAPRVGYLGSTIETAKDSFLNMPTEKLITVSVMVAILMLLGWGIVAFEILVNDKRGRHRLETRDSDDNDYPS